MVLEARSVMDIHELVSLHIDLDTVLEIEIFPFTEKSVGETFTLPERIIPPFKL